MQTIILKRPASLSISALALAVLLALPSAEAATLTAHLDRNSISTGDTVTLAIELPANASAQPDLAPLRQDFDILGTGSSSQMQVINGNSSQSNQLNITLAPHGKGNLTIPALKVGADETTPLQLTVKDVPVADSSKAGKPVWVEMETSLKDKQHAVTVQQEIPVTVRLYSAIPLRDVSLNPPAPAGATVEKLDQDKQYQTERNGQTYQVVEQHYAVFPEQAGDLNIPPVTLRAVTPDPNQPQRSGFGGSPFDNDFFKGALQNNPLAQQMLKGDIFSDPFGMFDSGKPVSLRSNGLQFTVGHIPAAAQGKNWLPARHVALTDSWQGNPPSLRSGEPASLTLTVTADGLTGAQIPAITLPEIPGVRVYSEPAQAESHTNGEQVTGISTQTFTLIPEQTGKLALPAISLPWWDTQNQTLQTAELPARTLTVEQGSGTSAPPPPSPGTATASTPTVPAAAMPTQTATGNSASGKLAWLTQPAARIGGGLLLLLLFAGGWFWYRRTDRTAGNPQPSPSARSGQNFRPATPSASIAPVTSSLQELDADREKFQSACAANDPYLSAHALLDWARRVWPQQPPASLPALAAKLEAEAEVRELHQHLYQPNRDGKPWSGEALAAALRQGLKPKPETKTASGDQGLPPLYPA
jgi:hypothetical protein